MELKKVASWGEEHGLINMLENSVGPKAYDDMKPDSKKKLEAERKEDSKLVKAKYLNKNGPHERLDKPYVKYAGDPIQVWHLIPNQEYDLPYGLIKEVNNPRHSPPKRSEILDSSGRPTMKDEVSEPIHRLIPVGF